MGVADAHSKADQGVRTLVGDGRGSKLRMRTMQTGASPKKKLKRTPSQALVSGGGSAPFKKPRLSNFDRVAFNMGAVDRGAVEWKNVDVSLGTLPFATATATWVGPNLLNPLAQGTTAQTRIGRKIRVKSVQLRYLYTQLASNSVAGMTNPRILIIYDRNPAGALPAVTDILSANNILAFMNLNNTDRFMIISDTFLMDERVRNMPDDKSAAATARNYSAHGKFYKKFKIPLEVQYNDASAGTIADLEKGSFLIMACCDGAQLFTNGTITLTYNSRIRYTDQ